MPALSKSVALENLLEEAHLRYIDRYSTGIFRRKKRNCFFYVDQSGSKINDKKILDRINALVLPPAWEDVWICPYANGHLQATGLDAAGRKQYRYHNRWLQLRNQTKFENLTDFGRQLPSLRRRLRQDLKISELNKIKACAIAITVMDNVFMRVGNSAYEQKYGSYGLTTLKNRHVIIKGKDCFFRFRGKKGVQQKLSYNGKELAKLLRKIKEIPGQSLFQYFDAQGEVHQLESGDINEYLKTHMGCEFTCKDFRTWSGTVLALNFMQEIAPQADKTDKRDKPNRPRNLHAASVAILDKVALALGNTRSVTKKYYVHPVLLMAFEQNELAQIVKSVAKCSSRSLFRTGEKELLLFLKHHKKTAQRYR